MDLVGVGENLKTLPVLATSEDRNFLEHLNAPTISHEMEEFYA
jgi:hypothetical protein